MFSILIVDDEQIEREGIKFLISKYKYELNVFEAEDGEEALELLEENPVDILFTDIKMPFMDGLELSRKARELYPDIKIIIFSAYGEFDYAKRAINLGVINYILKPVDVKEFQFVFNNVLDVCRSEHDNREKSKVKHNIYEIGIEFETENILIDLINGIKPDESMYKRMELIGMDISGKYIQMMLVDARTRFFDIYNAEFKSILTGSAVQEYIYVNLNEQQSIIFFVNVDKPIDSIFMHSFAEQIRNTFINKYQQTVTIVISSLLSHLEDICVEFGCMETMLDYKFFFDESVVLYSHGVLSSEHMLPDALEKLIANIFGSLDMNDYVGFERNMDLFFESLKGRESYSAVYIKYVCTEIVKKAFSKVDKCHIINFRYYVEEIFKSDTLVQVKAAVVSVVSAIKTGLRTTIDDTNKKVIRDIMNLIEENYQRDISLECVAEKVYLSPSYLSYFFKKETGQSFVKYITNYRLSRARELLQNTNMKIAEICEKVGYTNHSYFCLAFKNQFGVSPAKYRERE